MRGNKSNRKSGTQSNNPARTIKRRRTASKRKRCPIAPLVSTYDIGPIGTGLQRFRTEVESQKPINQLPMKIYNKATLASFAALLKIVRPLESTTDTQPQFQPALLKLSAMIPNTSRGGLYLFLCSTQQA